MTEKFRLGLIKRPNDILDSLKQEQRALIDAFFANPDALAFELCAVEHDELCFLAGGVHFTFKTAEGNTTTSRVQDLHHQDGAIDLALLLMQDQALNPYSIVSAWNTDIFYNADGPTDINIKVLPCGAVVLSIDDFETQCEQELDMMAGALESDDPNEMDELIDSQEVYFPKFASLIVPEHRLTSGHKALETATWLETATEQWRAALPTYGPLSFFRKLPIGAPQLKG